MGRIMLLIQYSYSGYSIEQRHGTDYVVNTVVLLRIQYRAETWDGLGY